MEVESIKYPGIAGSYRINSIFVAENTDSSHMISNKITPQELWSRQQINDPDVDYDVWNKKRESIREFSTLSLHCIFIVDVFKERYDFASDHFSLLFGYNPAFIKTIRKQGDLLEERIHPDDRMQMSDYQIEHGLFIYSLEPENRNDYQQVFQFRMLRANQQYINIISRHQVVEKDKNGKAWMIMGMMEISPDQTPCDKVKRMVINRKTGEIITPVSPTAISLTNREKEILYLIREGFLSKEIACKLKISIYTVHNHRKNILAKLNADNVIEALNRAKSYGLLY